MKNLTILTSGAHGGYGGIDKYVKNIIDALAQKKNIFKINIFSKNYIYLNKKNLTIKTSKNYYPFLILRNIINIYKSDLIIVTHINLIVYLFFLFSSNKKILLFSYGLDIWGGRKNFFYQIFIKKIKYFISMREYTLYKQKQIYQIKPKLEFLLHNPLDKIIKKPKINKRKKIIITVARLDSREKNIGIDETLESMTLIKKINFKYFIIGEGTDKKRLIKKAKELNIDQHVFFKGYLNDKAKNTLLKQSKVFLMPGSRDTFDTYPYRFAFLEAASNGLHIIASKPLKKEIIEAKQYKNFNFVNPNNKNVLIKKIIKLLNKKNFLCNKLIQNHSLTTFNLKLMSYVKNILND
tara:strand:- start:133 stop:1185 length:1053 start_codon:yes stop_codon:yes gene_type:complete